MNAVDIIIICVVSAAFIAAAGALIYRKIKGKSSGCDCGCKNCPHCDSCHGKK